MSCLLLNDTILNVGQIVRSVSKLLKKNNLFSKTLITNLWIKINLVESHYLDAQNTS